MYLKIKNVWTGAYMYVISTWKRKRLLFITLDCQWYLSQRKEFALSEGLFFPLTLLHSEWPKLNRVLALLSAIGLRVP